jgi:hypothetical protein
VIATILEKRELCKNRRYLEGEGLVGTFFRA